MGVLIQSFVDAEQIFAAGPQREGRVSLVRMTRGRQTWMEHPEPDVYTIFFGDPNVPLVRYERNGTVTVNARGDRSRLMARRVSTLSPFYVHWPKNYRTVECWRVTASSQPIRNVPVGYYHHKYVNGWMFNDGIRIVPIDPPPAYYKFRVEGGGTIQDMEFLRDLTGAVNYYVQNYMFNVEHGVNFLTVCPQCETESAGIPVTDIMKDAQHWITHIRERNYPRSLLCRALAKVPTEMRIKAAIVVDDIMRNAVPSRPVRRVHTVLQNALTAYLQPRTRKEYTI